MGIAATLVSNILLHMDGALHLSPKTVAHAAAPHILLTHRALACCVACQEDLECSLDAIRKGMPVQKAAAEFGIPSGTLYGRCKKVGNSTIINYLTSFPLFIHTYLINNNSTFT